MRRQDVNRDADATWAPRTVTLRTAAEGALLVFKPVNGSRTALVRVCGAAYAREQVHESPRHQLLLWCLRADGCVTEPLHARKQLTHAFTAWRGRVTESVGAPSLGHALSRSDQGQNLVSQSAHGLAACQ